jgi:ATP-dependent DNA ligase
VEATVGEVLFLARPAMNSEGIVSKRISSLYRSGRFDGWRKIKCKDYRGPEQWAGGCISEP